MVKNLPAMCNAWVQSCGWEDPLEEGMATYSSILAWRIPMDRRAWWATVHRVAKSLTWLSDHAQHSRTSWPRSQGDGIKTQFFPISWLDLLQCCFHLQASYCVHDQVTLTASHTWGKKGGLNWAIPTRIPILRVLRITCIIISKLINHWGYPGGEQW